MLGALQLLLLLLLYQPFPQVLNTRLLDWLYVALFTGNSLALSGLAFKSFSHSRLLPGLLAAALAFPGILYLVVMLGLLVSKP